jgi:nicotinate dehydrogenase subunit B
LVWTREEEFTWAYFRPAGVIEIKSAIAVDGTLTAWEFHNYNSGTSGIETPYVVPNQQTEFHSVPQILRSGSYRGLAATANHFARETHMDVLARTARMDALEFRLKNLSDPRMRAVLEAAAKSFGWPHKKSREGQGFGIAAGYEKGSYVATCVEVAVDRSSGAVRVVRVVEAFECGAIVNPDGLRNQVVGAIIQGLGGALSCWIARIFPLRVQVRLPSWPWRRLSAAPSSMLPASGSTPSQWSQMGCNERKFRAIKQSGRHTVLSLE